MTKSESKYFKTARIMDEALITLLCKKDIPFISVKEICEIAGVNRSTFYLHYESIGDLLQETVEYIQEEFEKYFTGKADKFISGIEQMPLNELVLIHDEYLIPYLTFIKEHKHIFKATLNNPGSLQADDRFSALFRHVIQPIFIRFGIPDEEQIYWLLYHINGVVAIIKQWLKVDCKESIEDMVRIIESCVRIRNASDKA